MNESDLIREAMSILGSRSTPAKRRAAKLNGSRPCRRGRRRGWPKGKRRKQMGTDGGTDS